MRPAFLLLERDGNDREEDKGGKPCKGDPIVGHDTRISRGTIDLRE